MPQWQLSVIHHYDAGQDEHYQGLRVDYGDGGCDQVLLMESAPAGDLVLALEALAHRVGLATGVRKPRSEGVLAKALAKRKKKK